MLIITGNRVEMRKKSWITFWAAEANTALHDKTLWQYAQTLTCFFPLLDKATTPHQPLVSLPKTTPFLSCRSLLPPRRLRRILLLPRHHLQLLLCLLFPRHWLLLLRWLHHQLYYPVADLAEKFTGGKQLIIINKICIKYFINIFSINL